MNRLWVRLTLAFALVTVTGVIVAAVLANYQVSTQFRRFVAHNQMLGPLGPQLADYYARHGDWSGVETVFQNLPGAGFGGAGRGMRHGAPGFILADAAGRVVYDGAQERAGAYLSRQEVAEAVPLEWQQQTVGYLLGSMPGRVELTGPDQAFLSQINHTLLQAGLIAGGLGLLLGLVIARGLSAPLGRLAAAARRISQGRLDQRVPVGGAVEMADLARAFNDMAANLQQAEALRRNLVADIAHELRTPLSVIQGNLQAILDDVYPLEKTEIAAIYDETLILNRLISDLRELAQAEAGQLNLNLQPTDLTPLITGAVDLFTGLAQEQGLTLAASLPDRLPPVLADPDRLRQVLRNLLTNALRHTPPGGEIRVLVQEPAESEQGGRRAGEQGSTGTSADALLKHGGRRSAVSGQLLPSAAFIRVSVIDTGAGIPASDLPHVFDRFWRADRSRSRQQGGSGLGLAIARQLVEAQGGQIGVESDGQPGHGSRFWFTLPLAAGEAA